MNAPYRLLAEAAGGRWIAVDGLWAYRPWSWFIQIVLDRELEER